MRRIVAASCDAKFFPHACDLIASVNEFSRGIVDEIVFFDLGLTAAQRVELAALPHVRIVDYPRHLTTDIYPDFLVPRMFAWKTFVLQEAAKFGDSILYLDCGCVTLNSLLPIFESIERDGIFLIQDVHRNSERTHDACFSIMQATAAERAAMQINAGVMGYRSSGKFARLFTEAFEYAKQHDCIFGDAAVHRHDQSIYSVLVVRHHVPPPHSYGRLVHWQGIQSREQIIWQHRGKWPAFARLREHGYRTEGGRRIAIYGAGKHTERFLMTLRNLLEPRHRVAGILDDAPKVQAIDGVRVAPSDQWQVLSPDVVIVSSDAHEIAMMERGRQIFSGTDLWPIYSVTSAS